MDFQLFRKRERPYGQQIALFWQHFWFESNYTSKGFFSFFEQKSDFFKNLSLRVCSDKAFCCYFDRFGMHGDVVIFFHFFHFFVKKMVLRPLRKQSYLLIIWSIWVSPADLVFDWWFFWIFMKKPCPPPHCSKKQQIACSGGM